MEIINDITRGPFYHETIIQAISIGGKSGWNIHFQLFCDADLQTYRIPAAMNAFGIHIHIIKARGSVIMYRVFQ